MNRKYQDSRGREWYALHVRTGEERDVAMDVYALGDADSLLPIERYRKFHDIWIPKNRLAGIRTSMAAADAGLNS